MRKIWFINCPCVDSIEQPWEPVPLARFEGMFVSLLSRLFKVDKPHTIYKMKFPLFDGCCGLAYGQDIYLLMYPDNGDRALISFSKDAVCYMYDMMRKSDLWGAYDEKPQSIEEGQLHFARPLPTAAPRIMVNTNNKNDI